MSDVRADWIAERPEYDGPERWEFEADEKPEPWAYPPPEDTCWDEVEPPEDIEG